MSARQIDLMGASFTIRLCDVLTLEQDSGNGHKIGLAEYPIWDADYREALNRKIIDHFYLQEIGSETISIFTLFLRRRMNEIMPYWNQVYLSEQIKFDPLATYDLTTIRDESGTDIATRGSGTKSSTDSDSTSGTTTASSAVSSTTPQTLLSGSKDYATGANRGDSQSSSTGNQNATGTTDTYDNAESNSKNNISSSTKGFQGSAANLLLAYRQTLLNVDMMVIDQLEDLFMGIWSTQDEQMPDSLIVPRRGMLH